MRTLGVHRDLRCKWEATLRSTEASQTATAEGEGA